MDCFLLNRRKDGPEWSIRPANVEEIEPLRMTNSRNVPPPVKVYGTYVCMQLSNTYVIVCGGQLLFSRTFFALLINSM